MALDELPEAVLAAKDVCDAHHERGTRFAPDRAHLATLHPNGAGRIAA